MKTNTLFTIKKKTNFIKMFFWLFIMFFGGYFVINYVLPYYNLDPETFGPFWDYKWALIGHISGGLTAIVIGPFQFWSAFRVKYIKTHRWLGRIYLIAVLIGFVSGTYLAWTTALAYHWTWALSMQGLAFAWIVTAGMAYIQVMRKRIVQHKEWMIRSYVVTFAFVLFRFIDELTFTDSLGGFMETGPSTAWLSWSIPLLITEIFISWNKN